jgi:hypothetical protein
VTLTKLEGRFVSIRYKQYISVVVGLKTRSGGSLEIPTNFSYILQLIFDRIEGIIDE